MFAVNIKPHQSGTLDRDQLPLNRDLIAEFDNMNSAGENVAVNVSIPGANSGLMGSPRHRANILSREFNAVGIGVVWIGNQVWVTQDFARRIQAMSGGTAAEEVAAALARVRAQAGLPRLRRVNEGHLSSLACDMGHHNHVNTNKALKSTSAVMATAYTTSNPEELSQGAVQAARERNIQSYAVGVCFQRSSGFPSGVYWVLLTLYAR